MVDNRIGYLLKRAQHALRLATDAALRPLQLTTPQYAALIAVETSPGASSAELARQAFVTAQTMNEIVRTLVDNGLMTRQPHPVHGRVIQLFLTEEGKMLLREADQRMFGIEAHMLGSLAPVEQEQLAKWLRQCSEALEDIPASDS